MVKLFHVPLEASAVDSLETLTIIEGVVLLCFGEGKIVLDWLRVPNPRLIFDSIINLIDRESQQSKVLFCS